MIPKRAFVLVTVYSDADRSSLYEIREIPSVKRVEIVLGAFDAVVTVESEDAMEIQNAVASIATTRGVKEAKPLFELQASSSAELRQVVGQA